MMDSQTTVEDISSPIEIPATPQPQDLDLSASTIVKHIESPSATLRGDGPSSSMTPPPSSQVPRRIPSPHITTPEASSLSSPPPTIMNGVKKEGGSAYNVPTIEEVEGATIEELRALVHSVLSENTKLDIAAREARMSAAHYKLQHNLLLIDSEETLKRLEVEHEMTRREVQALQNTGRDSETYNYIAKLKNYCKELEEEGSITRRRLQKAKQLIEDKDFRLAQANDEVERLRERIRQNREHLNVLRSPGGPFHIATPKTSPNTPQQYRTTPKHTPSSVRRREPPNSARPFEALLLADAVLSQENNSAPSTPIIPRHQDIRTPHRHQRAVQSLSSLPNTPGSARRQGNNSLLPSAQFSPEAEARVANTLGWNMIRDSRERRRKSRDSTISAEDSEQIARQNAANRSFREESEEIHESQASQSATEMLRIDPRESFEVAASRTNTPTPADKNLQQSKIYGSVTKSVAEKRKRMDEGTQLSAKKLRAAAGAAIGLGLNFDGAR